MVHERLVPSVRSAARGEPVQSRPDSATEERLYLVCSGERVRRWAGHCAVFARQGLLRRQHLLSSLRQRSVLLLRQYLRSSGLWRYGDGRLHDRRLSRWLDVLSRHLHSEVRLYERQLELSVQEKHLHRAMNPIAEIGALP